MTILMMTIYVKNSENHILGEFVKYLEMYPSNNVCDFRSKMTIKTSRLKILKFLEIGPVQKINVVMITVIKGDDERRS